ncbi:MAG: hypothetical protein HDR04_02625 [Lachnospiraceae bacterium]|nr:hypothetical protein [Lachnospiraceae bacterium]
MRQRKRRLCTALLCAVLIISNVLPAGMPVYAKSPDAGSDIMSTASSNETVSPMSENESGGTPDAFDGTNKQTGAGTGNNANSGNSNDNNIDSGNESDSDDNNDSDAGSNDGNDADNSSDGSNSGANNDNGTGNSDANTDSGDSDSNSDNGDGSNNTGDDSGTTPDNGDESNNDDFDTGDDTDIEDDPIENDTPNVEEDGTVSGNDAGEDDMLSSINPYGEGDYLTEDPEGYNLSDVTMTPGSYSADFSAISKESIYSSYRFRILYTTESSLADDFFKGKSRITEAELSDSSFIIGEFTNLDYDYRYENDTYDVSATFKGDSILKPDTTYYYRLVYYDYNSTDSKYCYHFLTVPDQFTTEGPVTESSISIRDVSVEEIGYQRAKIAWTIDNPNKEAIFDMKLHYTDAAGLQSGNMSPREYQDENYNTIPNKYYATVDLNWARKANVALTTYIGAGEKKLINSDEITITPKDINDATINLTSKVGTGSLRALVELSPFYYADSSIDFYLYYRKKSDTSWMSTSGYVSDRKDSTSASGTLQASNLSANTEYEYYIKPSGRLAERTYENLGTEDNPLIFTTKEIVTYEDTEFPDTVFRSYIKKQIGIEDSDQITSDKLEKLTNIYYDRSNASGNISSLQGIEHIENLTSISFSGHTITDVGRLDTLTTLTSINLMYNDLTELPDLSGMSRLTSANFGDNKINADTITEAKLPASLLTGQSNWIANTKQTQRAKKEVTLAPEYYVSGEARPFLIKVTGLKTDYQRKYTLSLTIGDITVSGTETNSYDGIYYIKDILKNSDGNDTGITVTAGTPCDAVITLTDNYGTEWLQQTASITFAAADANTSVVKTQYIRPNATNASVYIDNLPATYTKDNIANVTLLDQNGTPVGSASSSNIYINSSYYNPYEDVFGYFSIGDLTNGNSISLSATVYFAKYLSAGYYSAVVTTTDGASVTYEKAVCVDNAAVVDSLWSASNQEYDNYGDYLYVRLSGANIDPARVRPVFYENGENITEYISGIASGYNSQQAIYKLKKLKKDTYWNIFDSKTFTYNIEADKGYTFIDNIRDKSITLYAPYENQGFITFEHYNYKKGVYEVKTDSTVADGTQVSVSVCNNSSSRVVMGKAQGKITNSLLSLDFKNDQGESYAPPQDKEAYFIYTYTDAEGNERSFTHTNSSVKWYNYSSGSTTSSKTAYNSAILYHKALLKKLELNVYIPTENVQAGQTIDAQIYTSAGSTAVGEKTALTGKTANGYINYTGTWQDSDGLVEGIYQIRYSQNGKHLYSHNIYVYDDEKFYMNSQWMYEWSDSSGKGICFAFSSEQLAGNYIHDHNSKVEAKTALAHWNNGGYKLELFDRLGKPISGWKADHASWSGSNFYLYLKDVPEGYVGYYAKLTKSGRLGIRLDNGTDYYSTAYNATKEYGEWETFGNSSVWFNDDSATNAYYGFGSYAYPVTVTITKPYDTDVIHTFTASSATNGNYYYFTASDLKNIDPKEAYRITAVSVDGSSRSEIGYLAVRGTSTVVNATSVSLNKTTLNMQLNQTEKLTATVKPDNATNKNVTWTSDNTSVATVGTDGTVTAVSVGTAKITATTHNGKTTSCTVQVFNYTLSRTELSFNLSTWTPSQAETLKVSNGTNDISSSVTWSSNDESVATVTKDGVVTPEGAGSAKILAEVKNGPILECNVTVSRDTLTGVTLNESECTLYLDSKGQPVAQMPNMQQLKLYLTPSDTTVDKITWTSDQPAVASVAAKTNDPLAAIVTAHARGTAKISATVTTKSGTKSDTKTAECKITVQTVTTADDVNIPSELTALTNEQLTLYDVELPAGWEWMYPDVSLKQFAGMQAKAFAAKYKDPTDSNAIPYETELSVALSTVTGIAIGADSNSLRQGTDTELSVIWNMNGAQLDLSAYAENVTWSSAKESVAKVNPVSGTTTTLTAQGTGTTTVKAQVTFKDGKTYKAQYKVTVVDEEAADIQVTAVDNFTADDASQGTYRGKLDSNVNNNNGTVHVTVTGATKLTVKNNNAKVITTGKVTAEGSGYNIPLTIKAAGMAKITLTANDKAKTQKDIFLYVTDVKPNISEDTVTVNLWQTTGTTFTLYPSDGYQVTSASLVGDDAAKFTLTGAGPAAADATQANASQAKYVITAADGIAKGSYKLTLQGKVKLGTEEFDYNNVAFTVKVVEQAPKYKIKQNTKVNLFYKDWENSILEVASDEVLESMELTGCDFTVENPHGYWYLKAKSPDLTTNCNKKGTLTLHFTGYKDVTTNFTVGVEKNAPKGIIEKTSITLYPTIGLDSAQLDPHVNHPQGYAHKGMTAHLDQPTQDAGFSLISENGYLYLKLSKQISKNTTYKAKLILTDTTWTDEVTVPFTIKVSGNKPAAKLGKTTLQLNTNTATMAYDSATTTVMWKDGAKFDPLNVSVSAADAKSRNIINTGIVFAFDQTENQVIAKLNNTVVAKGSYKFKVNVKATDTLTVSTPLTIKIVDVAMDKAVKVSTKGSIDVLNREGTFVTATPALKSLNGNITGVRLSGRAAHLLNAECVDNKVIIHAKPDAALITKYNYKVKINLTIENAEGATIRYITPDINIKLKQGKPKVTVIPNNATFFSGSYEGITRNVSATLKGAENPVVTNVELMNNSDTFTCNYANGVITLCNTPNAIKGKTYSLQFRVTFYGQADNEKATTVKYTVKVK